MSVAEQTRLSLTLSSVSYLARVSCYEAHLGDNSQRHTPRTGQSAICASKNTGISDKDSTNNQTALLVCVCDKAGFVMMQSEFFYERVRENSVSRMPRLVLVQFRYSQ